MKPIPYRTHSLLCHHHKTTNVFISIYLAHTMCQRTKQTMAVFIHTKVSQYFYHDFLANILF